MFSVVVRQHYCQSNIHDNVFSRWHLNEEVAVEFFFLAEVELFSVGLCRLVPVAALSAG